MALAKNTVYVGNIEEWMDEAYLSTAFGAAAPVTNVKLVRERRLDGEAAKGFAFVEFVSEDDAAQLMQRLNGEAFIAQGGQRFLVNWAQHGVAQTRKRGHEVDVYVGNLDFAVREADLFKLFNDKYKSAVAAKIITDPRTTVSKGFGFVAFSDATEAELVLTQMEGTYLLGKPIRTRTATKQQTKKFYDVAPLPPSSQLPLPPPPPYAPMYPDWAYTSAAETSEPQVAGCQPQVHCHQPAITNMTTSQAHMQAWQLVGGAQEIKAESCAPDCSSSPGLEHFQALMQHPMFLQAFERQLMAAVSDHGDSDSCAGMPAKRMKLAAILHDRPDTFERRSTTAEANEEFLASVEMAACF